MSLWQGSGARRPASQGLSAGSQKTNCDKQTAKTNCAEAPGGALANALTWLAVGAAHLMHLGRNSTGLSACLGSCEFLRALGAALQRQMG